MVRSQTKATSIPRLRPDAHASPFCSVIFTPFGIASQTGGDTVGFHSDMMAQPNAASDQASPKKGGERREQSPESFEFGTHIPNLIVLVGSLALVPVNTRFASGEKSNGNPGSAPIGVPQKLSGSGVGDGVGATVVGDGVGEGVVGAGVVGAGVGVVPVQLGPVFTGSLGFHTGKPQALEDSLKLP